MGRTLMGILKEPAAFIKALPLTPGFSVCELGDQMLSFMKTPRPASEFYLSIGCARYVSIDANGGGIVLADLNRPVTGLKLGEFDLVTDFGTGEHIFDQAQVWRTLHELAKPGGFIVFDRPAKGYDSHCFYLINESVCVDLATANGYEVLKFELKATPRGVLVRGVFRRPTPGRPFQIPQQGRYRKHLQIGGGDELV